MADARKARRDAEKAARDALSGTLVGTAGDLGVAHAARQDAQVKEAADSAGEALTTYAEAWAAARDAGWSQAQLKAMGYEKASVPRKAKPAPARPAGVEVGAA